MSLFCFKVEHFITGVLTFELASVGHSGKKNSEMNCSGRASSRLPSAGQQAECGNDAVVLSKRGSYRLK